MKGSCGTDGRGKALGRKRKEAQMQEGKKLPGWKRKGAMEERSGILNERGEASPIEEERHQD